MLLRRFGNVQEDGCDELANTRDTIALREFSDEALEDVDLGHCSECLDEGVSGTVDLEPAAPAASLD